MDGRGWSREVGMFLVESPEQGQVICLHAAPQQGCLLFVSTHSVPVAGDCFRTRDVMHSVRLLPASRTADWRGVVWCGVEADP
jgi:hypothetical protein